LSSQALGSPTRKAVFKTSKEPTFEDFRVVFATLTIVVVLYWLKNPCFMLLSGHKNTTSLLA